MNEELECARIPARLRAAELDPAEWKSGLIHGPAGSGKSHLAVRMCAGAKCSAFVGVSRLIALERELAMDESDERWFGYHRLRRSEHLVLDDLGSEKLTEFAAEVLYGWIDERWGDEMETIVTSNLNPSEIADRHGDRIASRILGFGAPTRLGGKDWRAG